MKFIFDNWMLITVAVTSGLMLLWPVLRSGAGGGISATDAVQAINREKAVLIDVCEPAEFSAGHAAGAKNIPLSKLQAQLSGVAKNKAVPVLFICQSGMRSSSAVRVAQGLGYEKAQSLSGGLGAWRSAGLPVERA